MREFRWMGGPRLEGKGGSDRTAFDTLQVLIDWKEQKKTS